jgi:hypothetical protein
MPSLKTAQNFIAASLRLSLAGAVLSAAALSVGCGDAPQPVASGGSQPAGGGYGSQPAPTGAPASGQTPPAGGGAVEVKDPFTDKALVDLMTPPMKEKAEKAQELQKQHDAKPGDAKVKADLVVAKLDYADAWMFGESLPQRVKYRVALKVYRQVLELDPKNEKATASKKQIEEIYKSLGRPVPE